MKAIIFAAFATVAIASPAAAQTFTGPRAEVRVGGDSIGVNTEDQRDFNGRGSFGGSNKSTDFSFGGEVGFDVQVSQFVVGAYAGADITDVEQSQGLVNFRTGRNFTAGARAGFAISPSALLYVKGGYSNSRINVDFAPGAVQAPFANFKRNRNGIHFGGGVELAVTQRVYARADYTHTLYKDFRLGPNNEFRFNRNQLMGAVGIRF